MFVQDICIDFEGYELGSILCVFASWMGLMARVGGRGVVEG